MLWSLKVGSNLEFLEDAERDGFDIPELNAAPELYDDLLPVWTAFGYLLNGSGDISFTDLVVYMNEYEISDAEDREVFVRLIRHLQIAKSEHDSGSLKKRPKQDKPKAE